MKKAKFVIIVFSVLALALGLSGIAFAKGAIWTTTGGCGDPQNVNQYDVGSTVFINGDGFDPGVYNWSITGKPGGASCDPKIVVASGSLTIPETGMFCIAAYTIQEGDCGEYGVDVGGKKDNYRVNTPPPPTEPGISISKGVSTSQEGPFGPSVSVFAGTTVWYNIRVQNTGNVVLNGITLDDNILPLDCVVPTTLAVGESFGCTYSETATEPKTNVATADSNQTDAVQAQADVLISQSPTYAIDIIKGVSTDINGPFTSSVTVSAGTLVYYEIIVTNTGNSPLTGVTLVDDSLSVSCQVPAELAVGGSFQCTYSETATEPKTNVATADSNQTDAVQAQADVLIKESPTSAIDISKGVSTDISGPFTSSVSVSAGTRVYYKIIVINTGNSPLTGVTLVDDSLPVSCQVPAELAVGGSFQCTYSETATEPKTNVATADSDQTGPIQAQATVEIMTPTITQVPTMTSWGILLLSLLMGGFGIAKCWYRSENDGKALG
jgi:uncharacterized repeat protein (TIGR01451 family)